jgi:hypothetical protein
MVVNKNMIVGATASLFSAGFVTLLVLYLMERNKHKCVDGKCPDCSTLKPVCNIDTCTLNEVVNYVTSNASLTLPIARKAILEPVTLDQLMADAAVVDKLFANATVKAKFPC